MLVISRQTGFVCFRHDWAVIDKKIDGHVLPAAAMICAPTGSESQLKDLRGRVPVGRFFSLYFVGSCIVRTFCICWSPHGLLSCLSFSACVNGRDVRELDDLFVVLLLVYREPSSWRSWCDNRWEYKQAFFFFLFRSFFWSPIVKEKMFQKFIHIDLSKVVLTRAVGCSRLSVSKHFTLIFELRSADCLESMPLLSSKTPKKKFEL